MDSETRGNWIEAYSVWLGTDDLADEIDMMTAFGDMILIFANLTECDFRSPMRDLSRFCRTKTLVDDHFDGPSMDLDGDIEPMYEKSCSFGKVLGNISKNAFVFMGKGSVLMEVWKEFPSENPDTLMVQTMKMGEDIGTFVRVGIDFEKAKK